MSELSCSNPGRTLLLFFIYLFLRTPYTSAKNIDQASRGDNHHESNILEYGCRTLAKLSEVRLHVLIKGPQNPIVRRMNPPWCLFPMSNLFALYYQACRRGRDDNASWYMDIGQYLQSSCFWP